MRIGVLSRRAPISHGGDSGIAIEHVGGLTRVLPALAEFANINWSALTTQSQAGLPKYYSYAKLSNENHLNQIGIYLTEVNAKDLDRSDWFCAHYLWPLLHDLPVLELSSSDFNEALVSMNEVSQAISAKFFDETNDGYLVNDFQLARVPISLKKIKGNSQVTFFLHTPWPKTIKNDAFAIEVLMFLASGMLAADVIQFQTQKDLDAFEAFLNNHLEMIPRTSRLEVNPVSVNVQALQQEAQNQVTQLGLASSDISYVHIARTDPSKNTLETIAAFTQLAKSLQPTEPRRFLDLHLVPSRQQWHAYQALLTEIIECVERCNAELAELEYLPIRLHIGNDYKRSSAALTRYDYLIVCSVADGLNLVVKEGAILNSRNGVIVSTENVGAMAELANYCVISAGTEQESIAKALEAAMNLSDEMRQKMSRQQKVQVSEFDASTWAKSIVASFKILEKV